MKSILLMKSPRLPSALLCAASSALLAVSPARAQTIPSAHSSLPVRQVTLFTSGVAYAERGGNVEGGASVPLLFRTGQINDILKSIVLIDQRGQVQPATYATRDPVGHTLQEFAMDVTSNLTQEQVLNRLRGVRVSVETVGKVALMGQPLSFRGHVGAGQISDAESGDRATALRDGRPL